MKPAARIAASTALFVVLGCSIASEPVQQKAGHHRLGIENKDRARAYLLYEIFERQPEFPHDPSTFSACQLGTSCLALDPRPFELCLVSGNKCADKLEPPIQVKKPFDDPLPDALPASY